MSPGHRAIVAEPDPEERARLAELVRRAALAVSAPLEVIEVASGQEAALALEEGSVVLLVCEVLLPGRSGLSLLRQVREDPRRKGSVPVVLVTRMSQEADRYWGLRSGAHAYVTKPYDDEHLSERLRHALLGGGAERPRV